MSCLHYGVCGSCSLYDLNYTEQLSLKVNRVKELFDGLDFEVFNSKEKHFRDRAEFRIYRDDKLNYAMFDFNKKIFPIHECIIVNEYIYDLMPKLLKELENSEILKIKLYTVEFLSYKSDILVTLIYHKNLDSELLKELKNLEIKLKISIVARSKGNQEIISKNYITNCVNELKFRYYEGGFSQPNGDINSKMVNWVLENAKFEGDLLELYCGGGNFTIPLSKKFNKTLATEISKTSIKSAKENMVLNRLSNIEFVRLSDDEISEALEFKREFNRLKGIDLKSYNFSTIFLDPPRAGLSESSIKLSQKFDQIIYISCNPNTLYENSKELLKTHTIFKSALFDQFPFSNHIEAGMIFIRNNYASYSIPIRC